MTKPQTDYAALLKRSLLAIDELEARLAAAQRAGTEPVAIVGMACRFANGADSPEAFWEMLSNGVDAVTEVPRERWDLERYFDANPEAVGKSYTRWGSFLKDVANFDADLFGITPREAVNLDPQQRILLEVTWEALERAAIAPSSVMGSATAAYIGITTLDYLYCAFEAIGINNGNAYTASGTAHSMASGRLAYTYGLMGPNAAIDTACSSSHVALHLAVQSLRAHESNVAITGGVNLTLHPMGSILTSRARMMSFVGRCKTFDASADGYVRGEGCGILVLKRLSDAQRDGDAILAVIRGTALNQDGRSSGLTAPNGRAQEAVLRAALNNAGLRPDDIGYIEAHGTGTSLGDPIEMKALAEVFGGRPADRPLHVGSVKTNIGHAEAAAGIAGIIKTVLALQHRTIPPHLHLKNPNPLIPWDRFPVRVNTQPVAWESPSGQPRRAGISSFGFSGTNGHVVLEEATRPAAKPAAAEASSPALFVLSGHTSQALADLAARYAAHLSRPDAAPLPQIAHTLVRGRTHLGERLAFVAGDRADAIDKLTAFAGGDGAAVARGRAVGGTTPEVVFMFTGQGAQYAGMGRSLYDSEPVFRAAMDQCAALVSAYLEKPLLDVIAGEGANAGLLDDTAYTQPALFAIEYSLARLWISWGVEPTAVMGHSVGEYVAATLAGVFSLEDGLKLIAARARLMSALPREGTMVAVFADEATVRGALAGFEKTVSVAATNGPTNTVISGAVAGVEAVLARLTPRGVEFQKLAVSHAFHSPLMEPMLAELERVAADIRFSPPRIGLISNVTGRQAGNEIGTPGYWRKHVREAVRFGDSIGALLQDGFKVFLEVGPSSTLIGMARRCAGADAASWVSSLKKGRDDRTSLLEGVGELHVRGQPIAWAALFGDTPLAPPYDLPTYAFQRRSYWFEKTAAASAGARLAPVRWAHPFLGGAVDSALPIFQGEISVRAHPWLADHQIFDLTPFPATGFLELALAASREVQGAAFASVRDVEIREGLMLPPTGAVAVQAVVSGDGTGDRTVQIYSRAIDASDADAAPQWRLHARAVLAGSKHGGPPKRAIPVLDGATSVAAEAFYSKLTVHGASYGPTFRGIRNIVASKREVLGDIELPASLPDAASGQFTMHPALLDAALQLTGVPLMICADAAASGDLYLPVGLEKYTVYVPGARAARCHSKLDPFETGAASLRAQTTLFDAGGNVIADLVGLSFRRVTRAALLRALKGASSAIGREDWLFELEWRTSPPSSGSERTTAGHWIILADSGGVAAQVAERLESKGCRVSIVREPVDGAAVSKVLAEETARIAGPIAGVISLWALDAPLDALGQPDPIAALERAQQRLILGVLGVVRALQSSPAPLWLVTRGAQAAGGRIPDLVQAPLVGLGNVVAAELQDLRCVRIDLDTTMRADEANALFDTIWNADSEDRIALRDGNRQVARLVRGVLDPPSDEPRLLDITERGQLDNLQLVPAVRRAPARGEVELRVHATGLNFRDVLNALGMYPGDPGPLGNECSGVVTAVGEGVTHLNVGDEVIAMVDRSFATYVTAPAALTVHKPAQIGFVEAATLPVTFLTAAYALRDLGRLRKGERVLIHAATGGVGMAAVQIAKLAGAQIIGTAGSPAKRALARSLGVQHVADSRSLSFEQDVLRATGGEGVDVVLNSLAGEFIPASLRLLRKGGRFIEIGKTGIWGPDEVARQFPGIEYHALYLGEIAARNPDLVRGMLEALLPRFVSGELQPLPQRVFPIERAQDAFRFMAQGLHVGKVVVAQRLPVTVTADASYLVTGGLGGLGLACARWLVDLGARHLVLLGRREPSAASRAEIAELEAQGAKIHLAPIDVADLARLQPLIERFGKDLPLLRGVLHAAGAVDDGMLAEQTWPRFERVMAAKVRGTWNLHTLTRSAPLDFFVMFSAGAAVMGSPGQGNYAAANAFMDSLAHVRRAGGRPAVAIDWGSWSDVGMASQVSEQHRRRWESLGLEMIDPHAGVQMLQQVVQNGAAAQVVAMPLVRSKLPAGAGPLFAEILADAATLNSAADSATSVDVLQRLAPLSGAARLSALIDFLSDQVVRVFGLGASHRVDPSRSLMQMGMDSLMAMELRNRLQTALKSPVAVAELLSGPTLEELAAAIDARLVTSIDAPQEEKEQQEEKWEEGTL